MFFNLDGAATASFNSINTSYYQTQATVSANSTKKPLMAFTQYYTVSPDSAYEIALPAYKRQYIQVIQPILSNQLAIVYVQLVASVILCLVPFFPDIVTLPFFKMCLSICT